MLIFSAVINPVSICGTSGLILDKFSRRLIFCFIIVKRGIARLPEGGIWKHMVGIALFAGIGFTIPLIISGLAFSNPNGVEQAKCGILIASVSAGLLGTLVLRRLFPVYSVKIFIGKGVIT